MARLKLDISADRPARLDPATKTRFRAMSDNEVEALSADEEHASTDDELSAARSSRRLKMIRKAQNLTQDGVSRLLNIPVATIRDWEQGRREPDAAALSLLRVLEREPEAVRRAMDG